MAHNHDDGQFSLDLRAHDLPPYWDGHPIEWDETWTSQRPFICPPPKPDPCSACGLIRPMAMKMGRIRVTEQALNNLRPIRARAGERWKTLAVFRCTACGADHVIDPHTGEAWDLGLEDYGPRGSYLITSDT